MSDYSSVTLLDNSFDRSMFDCGELLLNNYLKQFALQNQKKNIVKNYIVTKKGSKVISGFYSLSYGSITVENAPSSITRGVGRYPIPIMILGRLAVNNEEKGKGLGAALLKDAVMRTLQASEIAGLKALFVQAKNEDAKKFYQKYSFIESPSDHLRLFLSLDGIREKA